MSVDLPFEPPDITDDDIRRASQLLNLPANAFYGEGGIDPRQEVLKSKESMDVAACPGSGKTTLLVAKLAILAEKWQYRTRGICVLSHTNAARNEIETKLGNTAVGRHLLSYPHFIGTIHGFVNEFLALPLLRSLGHNGTLFNTDISGHKIWKLGGYGRDLPNYIYTQIKNLEHRKSAIHNVHYVGETLDLELKSMNSCIRLRRDRSSDAFQAIDGWKCAVLREGYAAYEDTFAYGHRALKEHPYLASILRDRFPILFIDEAQDNSEEQSAILHRIFMDRGGMVIRQRFGDANQAIYNSIEGSEATKYVFPDPDVKNHDLPNSHRFGQRIANLADPLGLMPYDLGLKGEGPRVPLESGKKDGRHTIFLFDGDCACKVINAYAELLIETFSETELRKKEAFWAVGQVHRNTGDDHKPRHVQHYCSAYDPEMSRSNPQLRTFAQHIFAGLGKSNETGEICFAIEKIAEGILRLAGMVTGIGSEFARKHKHRYVLRLLEECVDARKHYLDIVTTFALNRNPLTKNIWDGHWKNVVCHIVTTIVGEHDANPEVDEFLEWNDGPSVPEPCMCERLDLPNICRYPCSDNPKVSIKMGSIHSIKGQTHTATLVLDTFWHSHNIEKLVPWIKGPKRGWNEKDKVEQKKRLKTHYVAMTRPTHLLCLAMKRNAFGGTKGDLDPKTFEELEKRGWRVKYVE